VCDLETSRMDAPYIYDISHLRVKSSPIHGFSKLHARLGCDAMYSSRGLPAFQHQRWSPVEM
jgi:hypothetical protein